MNLLEPLGDARERLAESLLERRVQLLVDGDANLLELLLVVLLDRGELALHRRSHFAHALVERLAHPVGLLHLRARGAGERVGEVLLHRRELAAEAVDLLVLRARDVALLGQQRLLEMAQRGAEFLARALGAARDLVAQIARLPLGAGVDRRAAQGDPENDDRDEGEKRGNEPVGKHFRLSQRRSPGRLARTAASAVAIRAPRARPGRRGPARQAPRPRRAARPQASRRCR